MTQHGVFNPPGFEASYDAYHFAAAVRAGDLLLCSGQIGMEADGSVPADLDRQYTLAFEAVARVLTAAGLNFDDVVEVTTFHVAFPDHLGEFLIVKDRYLTAPWPAWTAVGVTSLALPGAMVEIKITALFRCACPEADSTCNGRGTRR